MQKLELAGEEANAYDAKFLSLYELINIFTRKLEIKNRAFYYKINKELRQSRLLRGLSYNEEGLLSFEVVFEDYKKARKTGKIIYQIAPYLSSLSRVLASIYKESSFVLGEEKTKKILKESFDLAKKKYKELPSLEGYIPAATKEKIEATAFSITLTDRMISYLIEEVIKKNKNIKKLRGIKGSKPLGPSEKIEEEIAKFFE